MDYNSAYGLFSASSKGEKPNVSVNFFVQSRTPGTNRHRCHRRHNCVGRFGSGIAALLCVFVPVPVTLLNVMFVSHIVGGSLVYALPGLINLFCFIVAPIFGILGRKTEGRVYANIALAIVLSFWIFALICGIAFYICFAVLELPT